MVFFFKKYGWVSHFFIALHTTMQPIFGVVGHVTQVFSCLALQWNSWKIASSAQSYQSQTRRTPLLFCLQWLVIPVPLLYRIWTANQGFYVTSIMGLAQVCVVWRQLLMQLVEWGQVTTPDKSLCYWSVTFLLWKFIFNLN